MCFMSGGGGGGGGGGPTDFGDRPHVKLGFPDPTEKLKEKRRRRELGLSDDDDWDDGPERFRTKPARSSNPIVGDL